MAIKPEILDALETIDPEYLLEREGVNYTESYGSSGLQFNVQECPKCGGRDWKVFLNAETGLGNCFHGSCSAKFNKFTFIMALTGNVGRALDEYITSLAQEVGWRPRRRSEVSAASDKQLELVLPESYRIPFADGSNLLYLENRGITADVCKAYGLRYAEKSWFNYELDGQRKGQLYEQRVIIPVYDMDGQLVSFQGRDITGKAERKYLFPPGFASTGRYLYNANNFPSDGSAHTAIINEGVFDVIATDIALRTQRDLRGVVPVGTFGKHLSTGGERSQLAELQRLKHERGLKRVVFMWDAEVAAVDDAIAAAEVVRGLGLQTSLALLPKGKDPNEVAPSVVCHAYRTAKPLDRLSAIRIKMAARKG
ncbi:toprim domain-containing protein [Chromobacterium sp. ASV23]|uniref:toprim domain-containing protein n=1 Tax=Chromobacterium sp. ASV23 TaxID=2795110 RepID=UPI0018EC47A4|nr:toprim domain-containing protein [Chromobacterium sp. ASV23]